MIIDKERQARHLQRRYALLQAAAIIDAGGTSSADAWTVEECVEHAELLLAEIEKREKQ